MYFNIWVSRNT